MSKLTELYKRLLELEEETEECIQWLEDSAPRVTINVTISAMAEGRARHAPHWLKSALEEYYKGKLFGNIQSVIEAKLREKANLEQQFMLEVSSRQSKTTDPQMERVAAVLRGEGRDEG